MRATDVPKAVRAGVCAALVGTLVACSPTHNWRQVRHDGSPVQALLPCKPERAEREVALLGPAWPDARLQMLSCDVQGRTYALAAVALPTQSGAGLPLPPGAPEAATQAWLQATWASLKQAPGSDGAPPAGWERLPGEAWPALLQHWRGPGADHRGQPLQAELAWWFAQGWLVQAAVYGAQANTETTLTFFESVRLSP